MTADTPPVDAQPVEPLTADWTDSMTTGPRRPVPSSPSRAREDPASGEMRHLLVNAVSTNHGRSLCIHLPENFTAGEAKDVLLATLDAARAGDGLLREAAEAVVNSLSGQASGVVGGPDPKPEDFRWSVSGEAVEHLRAALAVEGSER